MTPEVIGLIGIILMLLLIMLKVPIAYSMFIVGFWDLQ